MTTLEFKITGFADHYTIWYWDESNVTRGIDSNAIVDPNTYKCDSVEKIDDFILPLKKKYAQVIQILPNGERRII